MKVAQEAAVEGCRRFIVKCVAAAAVEAATSPGVEPELHADASGRDVMMLGRRRQKNRKKLRDSRPAKIAGFESLSPRMPSELSKLTVISLHDYMHSSEEAYEEAKQYAYEFVSSFRSKWSYESEVLIAQSQGWV